MRYKHHSLLPLGAFKRQGSVVGGRSMPLYGGDSWQPDEEWLAAEERQRAAEEDRAQREYAAMLAAKGYAQAQENYNFNKAAEEAAQRAAAEAAQREAARMEAEAAAASEARRRVLLEQAEQQRQAAAAAAQEAARINAENQARLVEQQRAAEAAQQAQYAAQLAAQQQKAAQEAAAFAEQQKVVQQQAAAAAEQQRVVQAQAAEQQRQAQAAEQQRIAQQVSSYKPYNLEEFGGLGGSEEQSSYYNAAKLANLQMERGRPDLAQQFINQANELKAHLSQPYRIDTIAGDEYGTGGGAVLVTPSGTTPVVENEQGEYLASIAGSSSGDQEIASSTGATIDTKALQQQEAAAKSRPFGTGEGQALGYDYGIKNFYGDIYKKYDAQGNLTEFLDKDGKFQKASDVKPVGTKFNAETGQLDTVYSYGGREDIVGNTYVPGMSPFKEDQGGFLGEGGWSRMAGLVAAGLSAGLAGGAFSSLGLGTPFGATGAAASLVPGSAAAIGTAVAQGSLTSIALAGLQGASPQEMLKAGLTGAISAGISSYLPAAGLTSFEQAAARIGTQTGLAAVTGGDVKNALISSVISSSLSSVMNDALPKETLETINKLPPEARKVLMSTLNSTLMAGVRGQDISDAAIRGVTNGLTSVAKDFATGAFKDFKESDFAKSFSNTFGSDYEEFQELPPGVFEQEDDLAALLAKDAQEAMDRNRPVTTDTTTTTPPITDNEASIVDQFNTNPPAESFPVADQTDFNLPPLSKEWLIDSSLSEDETRSLLQRVESMKIKSDLNTLWNMLPNAVADTLALGESLKTELDNAIKSFYTGETFEKLTQAQQDKIFADYNKMFGGMRDIVLKALGEDADSPEAKSGVLTKALDEVNKFLDPYIKSISETTGLNTQYVAAGLGAAVPTVLGKTVNTIGKVTGDIKAGGWKDAFENTIDLARNKGIIPNDRFNFIGEGNVLYKVDADTPALSSSKLDQFNTGKLSSNDPVFVIADTYKIDPKVAATIIDNSARLGVPVSTAMGLGLVDNTGNISPAGDTFLNPPPNLGEPQQDPFPEPAPDLEPAPDVTPVIRPEQPANDPVVNPADPANDPVFVPPEPETPTAPTPDEEPTRPVVPILPPVTPEAPVIPDTGNPDLDEILSPTPISPAPAPETSPAPTPVAPPVQDPDAPPAPVSPPVTPTYPTDQPSPSTQPKSETDFAAALRALQEKIAANEAAGMSRDQAFSSAMTGFGTQIGGLGNQIGGFDQSLTGLQQGLTGLSEGFGAYQAANAQAAAKQKQEQNAQQLMNILGQQQTVSAKTPPGAQIDYLYDIGGESIFAPMAKKDTKPKQDGYYEPPVQIASGGSIDDLYEMLRSK